ncbi:MAG TPA: amino acid permease [bacterium]|jgi:APA family basic amino acid/polyamine antiporter
MRQVVHSDQEKSQAGFKRELTLLDATMIVIGSMIGSGIFIVSADIARTVGSAGWLMVVWAVSGVVTIIAALSYGELAGMFPQAGGQYVYLREAWNPLTGFLYGWTLFAVIQTGSIAAVGVAFAKFTAVLIPWFSEENILFTVAGLKISAAQMLAIANVAFLTWLNTRGIREGKWVQDLFTIAKTAALFGLIILGFIVAKDPGVIAGNFSHFWEAMTKDGAGNVLVPHLSGLALLTAFGVASVGSLFACDAWNGSTFTAAETKNPKRNVALSLALGTGSVVVLYLIANLAYILLLPIQGSPAATDVVGRGIQFAADDRVGTAAAYLIFGAPAAIIMAVFIMISTFGCNNGMILTGARVYYAMACDGLFFKKTAQLNKQAVPGVALIVQGIWAAVLCLSGKYGDLLDYVIFAVLIFYILTILGIFRLRKTRPDAERPYKAFGYPVLPIIYVLFATGVCVDLLIYKPRYTWPGMIIVLLGIPIYYIWKKAAARTS